MRGVGYAPLLVNAMLVVTVATWVLP
jgi:hypothetical protein